MGIFGGWFSKPYSDATAKPSDTFGMTILASSLADAQLLMMTAAERGIEIDGDITRAVLDAEDALQKKRITPEIAADFWQAYESLSHTLSPITIDSVRATHDLRQLRSGIWGYLQGKVYVPFSRKSAFRYKLLSTLTLLSLIALQVFWAIGNTLVIDIKEQSDRIVGLEAQVFTSTKSDGYGNGSDLSKRQAESPGSAMESSGSGAARDAAGQSETSSTVDTQELNRRIGELISWRNAEVIELKNWNRFWGRLIFFSQETWEKPDYNDLSEEAKTHVHYVSAQYVLHAISAYFLPILYGLLGASFYVLRQLPKDIEKLTFSMNSHIDYSLRITQGPLAGIMASFFFTETPAQIYSMTAHSSAFATIKLGTSSLSNFSPLAVAFLAGYSVELIFYVIDKIISTVTTRSAAPAATPMAQKVKSFTAKSSTAADKPSAPPVNSPENR